MIPKCRWNLSLSSIKIKKYFQEELSCGNALDKADSYNNVPVDSSGEFKSDSHNNNKNINAYHHRNNRGDNSSNYINIIAVPRSLTAVKLVICQRKVDKNKNPGIV